MNGMWRVLLALSFMLILSTTQARAGEISFAGVGDFAIPNSGDAKLGSSSTLGLGGGLQWETRLYRKFTFETGLLYFQRNYTYSGDKTNSESLDFLQLPVLIRYPLLWGLFSVGFGGYYGRYLGTVEDTSTSGSSTVVTQNSYAYEGHTTSDYGLLASLRLNIAWDDDETQSHRKFFVDARYAYGLADNSLTSTSLSYSDFQILIGLTFGRIKK